MNTYYLNGKTHNKNDEYESSQQNAMPVECYKFVCKDIEYCYTSRRDDVIRTVREDGVSRSEVYKSEYITRGEIVPGTKGSESEITITVGRDNPVALIFKGAPPEKSCTVEVTRMHVNDMEHYDIVFTGIIAQVSFENNTCELTITSENWLRKELPNGIYQYFCNNMLFDGMCNLNQDDWTTTAFIKRNDDLVLYSDDFSKYPDGYFNNGKMYFNNQVRLISEHKGNACKIKYPFLQTPRHEVKVTAGCDRLFSTCCKRFNNYLNFAGFPYCPPTDSEKNPCGKGAYWVDSSVIRRDTHGFIGEISL